LYIEFFNVFKEFIWILSRVFNGEQLSVLCKDVDSRNKAGTVVLHKRNQDGTVTIMLPLDMVQIQKNLQKGRPIFTSVCMTNVPPEYVSPIKGI